MAQGSEFPLRKPPGFHYDFFLLGVTTFIAGLIGIPAPYGLIPQAPLHTMSLLVMGPSPKHEKDEEDKALGHPIPGFIYGINLPISPGSSKHKVPVAVVEQRVSNLVQGSPCLVLLTSPFLHILDLIPRGVLAGLFWYIGVDTLRLNGITKKILYLLKDKNFTPKQDPLNKVRKSQILLFIGIQLVGFAGTFAITQTYGSLFC